MSECAESFTVFLSGGETRYSMSVRVSDCREFVLKGMLDTSVDVRDRLVDFKWCPESGVVEIGLSILVKPIFRIEGLRQAERHLHDIQLEHRYPVSGLQADWPGFSLCGETVAKKWELAIADGCLIERVTLEGSLVLSPKPDTEAVHERGGDVARERELGEPVLMWSDRSE